MQFKVAELFGCPVAELETRITHKEYLEWCAYLNYVDRQPTKIDMYLASLSHMYHAVNFKDKRKLTDFIIGYQEIKKKEAEKVCTDAEIKQILTAWKSAVNAKFAKKGKQNK